MSEGALEQIDKRLGSLEVQLVTLRTGMDTRFAESLANTNSRFAELAGDNNSRFTGINSQLLELRADQKKNFYWVLALILVSILLPELQRYVLR